MIWTDETLKRKGYDGLYDECHCACEIGDLRPCGLSISETLSCKPGYMHDSGDEFEFIISEARPYENLDIVGKID
jgi:hypothetical protein